MSTIVLGILAWFIVSIPLGIFFGKLIETKDDDEGI
jgi:hypothetical protein